MEGLINEIEIRLSRLREANEVSQVEGNVGEGNSRGVRLINNNFMKEENKPMTRSERLRLQAFKNAKEKRKKEEETSNQKKKK